MSWRNEISKSVRELRFVFCQTSQHSKGIRYDLKYILLTYTNLTYSHLITSNHHLYRTYILNNYTDIKGKNPETPFIVRECLNAQPTVMARYDFGVEKRIYVPNLNEAEIDQIVKELVEQAPQVNAAIPNRSI